MNQYASPAFVTPPALAVAIGYGAVPLREPRWLGYGGHAPKMR